MNGDQYLRGQWGASMSSQPTPAVFQGQFYDRSAGGKAASPNSRVFRNKILATYKYVFTHTYSHFHQSEIGHENNKRAKMRHLSIQTTVSSMEWKCWNL